jgi:hypothetical protein
MPVFRLEPACDSEAAATPPEARAADTPQERQPRPLTCVGPARHTNHLAYRRGAARWLLSGTSPLIMISGLQHDQYPSRFLYHLGRADPGFGGGQGRIKNRLKMRPNTHIRMPDRFVILDLNILGVVLICVLIL